MLDDLRKNLVFVAGLLGICLACTEVHFEPRAAGGAIAIHDDLFAVSAVDEKLIVAVGYWGAIYRSEDGGETWSKSDSGTQRSLYGVSLADAERGWVVGQLGTILRTTDGGKTWQSQANPKQAEGSHLFAVHAIDANTAWVVGEWGTRLFTADGGLSWQDLSLTIDETHPQFVWLAPVEQERVRRGEKVYEDVGLNDVYCLPEPSGRCWIVGEFGYIFHSETHGQGWERGRIEGEVALAPLRMAYNDITLADSDSERLGEFADALVDAQHLSVEIDPVATAAEAKTFAPVDDPSAFFELIEARAQEVRSVLENAGILGDRIRMRGMPPWDYEDFAEDDPEFLQRYLAGRTHEFPGVRVGVVQNPYLFTVRFFNEETGLLTGLGGVVLRSKDSGKSWNYVPTDRKQAFFAAGLAGGRAVAVGEKGLVRFSADGGRGWRPPQLGEFPRVFTFMRDVDFAPGGDAGFIVGQGGMILRSRDSGRTWTRVLPKTEPVVGAAS